jgi:hypothetical protein
LSSSQSIAPLAQPIGKQVAKLTAWIEALVTTTATPTKVPPPAVEPSPYVPLTPADFANASQDAVAPSKTIAAEVAPVQAGESVQSKQRPLTAIAKQVQGSFKGLTAKRESKPVYVRKQFRAPETDLQAPGDVSGAKPTIQADPESIASDAPTLEAPPILEAIDATIADGEATDVAASPPSPSDAESSGSEQRP